MLADVLITDYVIGAIDSLLGIGVCITLIVGSFKEKPGLILPWLMASVISIVYYFIAKVLFVGEDGFTIYNAVFVTRIRKLSFFL